MIDPNGLELAVFDFNFQTLFTSMEKKVDVLEPGIIFSRFVAKVAGLSFQVTEEYAHALTESNEFPQIQIGHFIVGTMLFVSVLRRIVANFKSEFVAKFLSVPVEGTGCNVLFQLGKYIVDEFFLAWVIAYFKPIPEGEENAEFG
jgi:hypothetical protein